MAKQSLMPVVKVGVGLPQKWTFLVDNAVQMLCPGIPGPGWWIAFQSQATVWLDAESWEWLTFVRNTHRGGISSSSAAL